MGAKPAILVEPEFALPSTEAGEPPEHAIALAGGAWSLWRWAALRSAGFPADDALSLASSVCAAAADEVITKRAALEAQECKLLNAVEHGISTAHVQYDFPTADVLARMRRQIRRGNPPANCGIPAIAPLFVSFQNARKAAADAYLRYNLLFSAAREATSGAVREIARSPRFREALTWQNHPLLQTCLEPLLRRERQERSGKKRQYEELIASYLHRYCVKNDTIGFFGPVGWARLDAFDYAVKVEPGADLLATRSVYFEQWAVDLLACHFSRDETIKPWIAARPSPVAKIRGREVHVPFRHPVVLAEDEMAILQACDGTRAPQHLAEDFCQENSKLRLTRERLAAILEKLSSQRLISLQYDLPLDAYPERRLRELLERVENEKARRRCLASLEQLEAGRDAVRASAGDADRLRGALLRLENDFTSLTGEAADRYPGQMYWGRRLVYEDCLRDVCVQIGEPVLKALGPPLSLLLSSARWLTYQVGRHCRMILSQAFERIARHSGSESVGFTEFYNLGFHLLSKKKALADIAADLQGRWAEILCPSPGANLVRYSSLELQARVAEVFNAIEPGWPGACYHSPDLMIAACSVEAIQAGDFQLILGELHMGANTLRGQFLVEQHPDPAQIFKGVDADLPGVRLSPITPRRYTQRATRIYPMLTSESQYFAATTLDSIPPFGSTSLPAASLTVRRAGERLVVESAGSDLQFDVLQSFAGILARIVVDQFSMLRPRAHTPRVVFDRLVVAREAWRFAPGEIEFAAEANRVERFVAARRWRMKCGMPRWVFVRIPSEGKPIYLDFESPLSVDILARRVRNQQPLPSGSRQITVTEMLPAHGQHWLTDARGNRYGCELRIVAVDSLADGTVKQEWFRKESATWKRETPHPVAR